MKRHDMMRNRDGVYRGKNLKKMEGRRRGTEGCERCNLHYPGLYGD